MKRRFIDEKTASPLRNIMISLLLFIGITGGFLVLSRRLADNTDTRELQTLTTAIHHNITQCYALEGAYPEDLQYLKEHYGLFYNEDKYIVHYQALGENLLPNVTVIAREGGADDPQE